MIFVEHFDYFSITLLLGGFTALISGILVILHDRKREENKAWLALNVCSAIWSFSYFAMINADRPSYAADFNIILHAAAIYIPIFYFLFILTVLRKFHTHRLVFFGSVICSLFLLVLNPTKFFVQDVIPKLAFRYAPDAGPLYFIFAIYFFTIVVYALVIILKKIRRTDDLIERKRLQYIWYFTIAGFAGGGSVFLLTFNIPVMPYPLILFALYPAISGYAIFKYQLFNIRMVTAQILTFGLWIFILIRAFLADTQRDQLIDSSLLLVSIVFGIFLIRSVGREVRSRERVEKLAADLETANERLKELDKMKSEFLSIASHQIRAPITAIKGYASLILEGNFGNMNKELHDAVEVIFQSSNSMAIIVDDFLNISRIEQGRMKYDYADTSLLDVVTQVFNEQKPNVEKRGLSFDLHTEDGKAGERFTSYVDPGKIKQALTNLIDNAIKYTPKGGINVFLERLGGEPGMIRIRIKDTGIGVPRDVAPKLFQKFARARGGISANVTGTGLGLYVVKQMVEAQKGRVWVESEGEGKGSTFIIELAGK